MLDRSFFHKRFSVGLSLDTNLREFDAFLDQYQDYINNFYFSLPLGDKFHARTRVVEQMHDPDTVVLFWQLLACIRSHGIKLELVLNNGNVSPEDVEHAARMLDEHGIEINLVGITDDIYEPVRDSFPTQELVYSFKNHTHTQSDFANLKNHYQEIVLGRQNIRNTRLFSFIRQELKSDVVLLLNNGCSHICGGCTTLRNCHRAYYQAGFRHSPEYLYALQSILPSEIHSRLLDVINVKLFKISSRNASVQYLADSLHSYIFCEEDQYIHRDTSNYMLWARLAWHVEHYRHFSLERIRALKEKIYRREAVQPQLSHVRVMLDLRNHFLFSESPPVDDTLLEQNFDPLFRGIPWKTEGYFIGASNCANLLKLLDLQQTTALTHTLRRCGKAVYFALPPLTQEERADLKPLWDFLTGQVRTEMIQCIVANDWDTVRFLRETYGFSVAPGERIMRPLINAAPNDYLTGNDPGFGSDLLPAALRETCVRDDIPFILCGMPEDGLCVSEAETFPVFAAVGLTETFDDACHQRRRGRCDGSCATGTAILKSADGRKLAVCADSICLISRISDGIVKTVTENRVSIVIPPIWKELL